VCISDLFPALVQVLLQQVVSVNVLRLPHTLHGLLVHFQAHRWHMVSPTAGGGGACELLFVIITLKEQQHVEELEPNGHFYYF